MTIFNDTRCWVYFITAGDGHPIKIGISVDPDRRLREVQTGSPVRLDIIHLEPGGQAREAELHRRWAAHRLEGEWFTPAPEILAYVSSGEPNRVTPNRAPSRFANRFAIPSPAATARVFLSPLIGAWRIVTTVLLWTFHPPTRRRRGVRRIFGLTTIAAGAAGAVTAYLPQVGAWAAVIAAGLIAATVIGWPERV